MRKLVRIAIVIGSVAAAAPLGTALAQTAPAPPQTGTKAPAAQPGAKSETDDIAQIVEEALSGIDLRSDQKDALQKLGATVDEKIATVDKAKRALLDALADEIAQGKVDTGSLHPQVQDVVDAASAASPDLRTALEKVHDTLDAKQRKQFVDSFRSAMQKRAPMFEARARVDELAKTLSLTDDQKTRIEAILAEDAVIRDVARARVQLVLAAFPGEVFEFSDLLPAKAVGHRTERMLDHMIDQAKRIDEVLTPDQRTTAAKAIHDKVAGKEATAGGERGAGTTSSSLEATGTTSDALWAGGGRAVGYRSASGFGVSSGYAAGYGGTFMW
jgi:hypothetical protein